MLFSYHVHSKYSDGRDTIKDIVNYAKKLNLSEIGISDHFCISDQAILDFDLKNITMPKQKMEQYLYEIEKHKKNFPLKTGLEVDYIEGYENEIKKFLDGKDFDYLIGSVHFFENISIDGGHTADDFFTDEICRKYWQTIKKMAESGLFDIAAHLDVIKKYGNNFKGDFSQEIFLALQAIKKADMVIEINTSGWFRLCKEQYPSLDILKMARELDIPVIISADAHCKEYLVREFEKAGKILKELGFEKTVLFNKRKKEIIPL